VLTLTRAQLSELKRDAAIYENVIVADVQRPMLDAMGTQGGKVFLVLGRGTASAFYADATDSDSLRPDDLKFGMDNSIRVRGLSDTLGVPSLWDRCRLLAWASPTPDCFMSACWAKQLPGEMMYVLMVDRCVRTGHLPYLRWTLPPDSLGPILRRLRSNRRAWKRTQRMIFLGQLGELGTQFRALLDASNLPEAQEALQDLTRAQDKKRRKRGCLIACGLVLVGTVLLAPPCLFLTAGPIRQEDRGIFLVMATVAVSMIVAGIGLAIWAVRGWRRQLRAARGS
jgi:hypothetical protein